MGEVPVLVLVPLMAELGMEQAVECGFEARLTLDEALAGQQESWELAGSGRHATS